MVLESLPRRQIFEEDSKHTEVEWILCLFDLKCVSNPAFSVIPEALTVEAFH